MKITVPDDERGTASCEQHDSWYPKCEPCMAALKFWNKRLNESHMNGYSSGLTTKQKEIDGLKRMLAASSERKEAWRDAALAAGVRADPNQRAIDGALAHHMIEEYDRQAAEQRDTALDGAKPT